VVGPCEGGDELSDSIKCKENPRSAEERGASRKQLCSMEVVCFLVDSRGRWLYDLRFDVTTSQ
jgi:hypothetical protein